MLIRSTPSWAVRSSEITPHALYVDRRRFLAGGAAAAGAVMLSTQGFAMSPPENQAGAGRTFPNPLPRKEMAGGEEITDKEAAFSYNNFYEFGTGKGDPKENAHTLKTKPWSVAVEGECAKPGVVPLETLIDFSQVEERVYRLRCVEAWSMVIPWVGVPLGKVLAKFEPTSKAKYVAFETLVDPEQMPYQRRPILDWPYREGLRIDEAMNDLTLLAVGMYGQIIPNQNGAPVRLVVPWKYGFKSIKSIVKIAFTEKEPKNTWQMMQPSEYGFYANVNPEVTHPRWSQARERRIGDFFRRETLPFNGYGEQVASLYAGMDPKTLF